MNWYLMRSWHLQDEDLATVPSWWVSGDRILTMKIYERKDCAPRWSLSFESAANRNSTLKILQNKCPITVTDDVRLGFWNQRLEGLILECQGKLDRRPGE